MSHSSQHSGTFHSDVLLQAEVHYRSTRKGFHHGSELTIVLNNMRLMLILDWWLEMRSFISQKIANPVLLNLLPQGLDGKVIKLSRKKHFSPLLERSQDMTNPVAVSTGIVTKRAPVLDIPASTFELKMNISDCELIVVGNPAEKDTNAVILKVIKIFILYTSYVVLWFTFGSLVFVFCR